MGEYPALGPPPNFQRLKLGQPGSTFYLLRWNWGSQIRPNRRMGTCRVVLSKTSSVRKAMWAAEHYFGEPNPYPGPHNQPEPHNPIGWQGANEQVQMKKKGEIGVDGRGM